MCLFRPSGRDIVYFGGDGNAGVSIESLDEKWREGLLKTATIMLCTEKCWNHSPRCPLDSRGRPSHNSKIPPDNPRINGWRTFTPLAWAIAPTANGSTAAPPPPNAAANPIELTCRCRGRSLVVIITTAGKRGPRKNPWNATATADA